jgi:hypothetical protein
MTVRLQDPPVDNTEKLLEQILIHALKDDEQVLFLAPSGGGPAILQRIRMMISRRRKRIKAEGRKAKEFRFRSTIHPETHSGVRYDACVVWIETSPQTIMLQILEDNIS